MRDVPIVIGLAVREWLGDWQTSLCLAIGVAAAAAPLLLLLSVRSGIISQMREELERYPSSRELVTLGEPRIGWQMVDRLAHRSDVAFVAPLTRLLAASAVLRSPEHDGGTEADLVPSGPGDPLLSAPWRPGMLALSEPAARELKVSAGERVSLIVTRRTEAGVRQAETFRPLVAAIIPSSVSASSRRMALIDRQLLTAIEIWREEPGVADMKAALALARRDAAQHRYAGLRLYARSIDDVSTLREMLIAAGIDTESRADDIRLVRRLDTGLTIVLGVVASVIAIGLCLSLAVAQWGWVHRKRADLSYLRLIGIDGNMLGLIPIAQAALTVCLGMAFAIAITWGGHHLVNALFAGQLASVNEVSRLDRTDIAIVTLLSFAAGAIAAGVAASQARRTTPVAALRGA